MISVSTAPFPDQTDCLCDKLYHIASEKVRNGLETRYDDSSVIRVCDGITGSINIILGIYSHSRLISVLGVGHM